MIMALRRAAPSRSTRFLVPLLIAFAALIWQSLVVASHVHAVDRTVTALAGEVGAAAVSPHQPAAPAAPGDCPICQSQALHGSYLSPAPFSLVVPFIEAVGSIAVGPARAAPLVHPSYAWRSRAPPRSSIL